MDRKYDLKELLENPHRPLTGEQYGNFDKYMAMTNDDKSARDVDIGPAIDELVREINEKKNYWW